MKTRHGNATGILIDGNIIDGNGTPRMDCAGPVICTGRPKGSIRRFCIRRPRIRRPKGLIRRFWVDPRIEHEFNKVFTTTSKEGK
jgi:hypothetical protein